jgi:enamine deaminase RidA (YjgF/YER057c/UK114 family)
MTIAQRCEQLGLKLPPAPRPIAAYLPCRRAGTLIFLSGAGPIIDGAVRYRGKIGRELSLEEGCEAARLAALNLLAVLNAELEKLDNLETIVKVNGYVNCLDGFEQQPQVINGASELLIQVFGDKGRHARSAVACNALPLNIPVEIEMIVQVVSG